MRSLKTVVNLIASLAIAQHYVLSNQLPSPTFRVMVTKKGLDYCTSTSEDRFAMENIIKGWKKSKIIEETHWHTSFF